MEINKVGETTQMCNRHTNPTDYLMSKLTITKNNYVQAKHFCLTLWWGEEVEEGVVRDCFGDRPHCTAALVLLFLLDCFQRDVLALRPLNRATAVKHEQGGGSGRKKAWSVSNILNVTSKLHLGFILGI